MAAKRGPQEELMCNSLMLGILLPITITFFVNWLRGRTVQRILFSVDLKLFLKGRKITACKCQVTVLLCVYLL